MRKICLSVFLAFMLTSVLMTITQAQSPQQTFTQYISDLQKSPNDSALREKIINHVQAMRPAPAVPTEVVKHEGAAEYAFKGAKNESDYLDSAKEYEKALLIAPWLAIDYFNCGVAYEKAGQFKNAITQFNFYLMAAPDAQDANAVRKRIGGLEYAAGKAARESSSQQTAAAPKQNPFEDLLKKIDGRRYTVRGVGGTAVIDVRNGVFVIGVISDSRGQYEEAGENSRIEIRGRETRSLFYSSFFNSNIDNTYIISEDGERITKRYRRDDGTVLEHIFLWQR